MKISEEKIDVRGLIKDGQRLTTTERATTQDVLIGQTHTISFE